MERFTNDDLRALADECTEHCLSIYLPTHRGGKETRQDPIRLRLATLTQRSLTDCELPIHRELPRRRAAGKPPGRHVGGKYHAAPTAAACRTEHRHDARDGDDGDGARLVHRPSCSHASDP